MFHIPKKIYLEAVNIEDQASKNFFYDIDNKIENPLADLEANCFSIIEKLDRDRLLPAAGSSEHSSLLYFISHLHSRTLKSSDLINEMTDKFSKIQFAKIFKDLGLNPQDYEVKQDRATLSAMLIGFKSAEYLLDLEIKLLVNETSTPFITSDHPVIYWNQFLNRLKLCLGNKGLPFTGFQIFLPIGPKVCMIFFDKRVYKVGGKSDLEVRVTNSGDINQINALQFCNSNMNLYFDSRVTPLEYVNGLFNRYDANKPRDNFESESGETIFQGELKKAHLITSSEINLVLKLSVIKERKKFRKKMYIKKEELIRRPESLKIDARLDKLFDIILANHI